MKFCMKNLNDHEVSTFDNIVHVLAYSEANLFHNLKMGNFTGNNDKFLLI